MELQLDLFSDKVCTYCGDNPGPGKNSVLWNGFLDKETGDLVCWKCRKKHYGIKSNYGKKDFSIVEFPIYAVG